MRTFYLFKIKNNIKNKTKNNSYALYKALETIYHLNQNELSYYYNYFDEIRDFFNKKSLDSSIYNTYKDKYIYTKVNNYHIINDYFTKESSKLIVKKNYICLKSTKNFPVFLKSFINNKNIFVCDFKSQDYFWLEELV